MRKKELQKKEMWKNAVVGISAFLIFLFVQYCGVSLLNSLGLDTSNLSETMKIVISVGFDITLIIAMILLYRKSLKQDWQDIKKNHKTYFQSCLKYWLLALLVMIVANFVIIFILSGTGPKNEETIRDLFAISPIYMFFSAVFYAPFVEEMVFRKSFKNIFSTKWLFIILSGVLFGSLHVIGSATTWLDLLYIIPYSAPGIAFAYMLWKTDNILVSMGFHFMHNGILMALQVLLLLFG